MTTEREALPPLPATSYVLAREARPYQPERLSNEPGYDADQMHAHYLKGREDERAALAARVAQAWQPIETAPKDGTEIVLFGDARWPRGIVPTYPDLKGVVGVGHYAGGIWQFMSRIGEPTHWMPLPHPPKEQA